jgi:hypothetical protein
MRSPLFATATLVALLAAPSSARAELPADAPSPPPLAPPPPPDGGPLWSVLLRAEVEAVRFLGPSTLGRQLASLSYEDASFQGHFAAGFDRFLFGWLGVGIVLDARLGRRTRPIDDTSTGFHTLNALLLLRPTFRLWGPGPHGLDAGLELAAGGGGALWVLRGKSESAPGYRLEGALAFAYAHRGLGIGGRIGVSYTGSGPFGPRSLGANEFGILGGPTATYRW